MAFYDDWEKPARKSMRSGKIMRRDITSEETVSAIKSGAEKLGDTSVRAVTKLRGLFEKVRERMKKKDVIKLEDEISKLEEEKKNALEKMGLIKHKEQLEKELAKIKMKKLYSLV